VAFDIEGRVRDAIVARGSVVSVFGVERALGSPEAAATLVNRFRDALTAHFLERHSLADGAIWNDFASQVHAQLERNPTLDDSALTTLLMTVDGL
jgi:hypothetical protein